MLGSWQGPASATYAGTCLSQSEAVSRAADGWILAAGVLGVFATELEDAREDARAAIREAEDTTARMKKAQTEIDGARDRLGEADLRAGAAALELSVGALAGAPTLARMTRCLGRVTTVPRPSESWAAGDASTTTPRTSWSAHSDTPARASS